jgi:divalent metal cation (Fe/Co/Zn/Cd) transporter
MVPVGSVALLRRGLIIEYASLVWMIIEASGAILAGFLAGSLALIAFGGDSIVELLSSITVLHHLRLEDKGEDTEGKIRRTERATIILLFMLIPIIGLGTLYAYASGVEPESSPFGILIALGAVVIMPVVWFEKRRIGKKANCLPLVVDSTESSTCLSMSAALLVGLVANLLWRAWWIDYVTTVIILIFLTRQAVESAKELQTKPQWRVF